LTIELLVFAVDIITEEQLPLESGMYYELAYQSAVAVKTYAGFFEITENELPWYSPAENKFQQLLLEGPVLHGDDLQYLYEKREHLNLWRQSV
jgi:hypothetical protein